MNPSSKQRMTTALATVAFGMFTYFGTSAALAWLESQPPAAATTASAFTGIDVPAEEACPYPPGAPAAEGKAPALPDLQPFIELQRPSPVRPAIYFEPKHMPFWETMGMPLNCLNDSTEAKKSSGCSRKSTDLG